MMKAEVWCMLYEIICDKFKEKRIEFHPGLNTVLGTEKGDNSIGKSTFLGSIISIGVTNQ